MSVETEPRWFGDPGRPLLGWLSTRAEATTSGVVVAPPVGYEHFTSYRALRLLAESLAARGHTVLRFDYDGTGDSAGDQWDPGRVEAWRGGVRAAAAELRSLGCDRIVLAGLRLGATFSLLDAAELGAEAVVCWAPILSGRRYARELRLLAEEVPGEHLRGTEGAWTMAGDVYTAEVVSDLGSLSLPPERATGRTLLVGDGLESLAAELEERGSRTEVMPGEGTDGIVATSAERAVIPAELIERIAMWVGDADAPALAQRPGTAPAAALDWGGTRLREQVEAIGPHGLRAIVTEPADGADDPATLVFLNSGSEPHYGPGRAWVAFARDLAARGRRTVRADFRGWGESPGDDPAATPSPYAESCVDDARSVARALAGDGRQAVLFGLCSSAYVALQVAAVEPLAGCVALNPQLYWRPGQPIDLTPAENHLFRQPIQRKEERWQRLHVWSALDLLGARTHAGRWLDVLRRRRAPVTLVFSKGDDGMHYLRVRLGRRFARYLGSGAALVEIDGVDHALHRSWLRGSIVDVLDDALARAEPVTP